MKLFRVRLRKRNVYTLYIVGALTLVVLNLLLSYHLRDTLLANLTSSAEGTATGVKVLRLSKVILETTRPTPPKEDLKSDLTIRKGEGLEDNSVPTPLTFPVEGDHKSTPPHEGVLPSRAPSLLDKVKQKARSKGEHHLKYANEDDYYRLGYDYDRFMLDDLKELPGSAPRLNLASPETLRARALTYSNTSSMRTFLREQQRRAEYVSKMCDTFEPSKSATDPPPDTSDIQHLLFDGKNPIAYCPVHKAASTSWSTILLEIIGVWDLEHRRKKKDLYRIIGETFQRVSQFDRSLFQLVQDSISFMVVRHPFERLLSCYRNKFENARKTYYYDRFGHKMVRQYRKVENLTARQILKLQEQVFAMVKRKFPSELPGNPFADPLGPTFPEFVQYILHARHSDDEHWRSIFDHCSPCHMDYQFILRFEYLNQEGGEFIEYLNKTSQVQMRWENLAIGGTSKHFVCKYYSQLTKEIMDDLINKYEKDFLLYEYKPDAYLNCVNNNTNIESDYSGIQGTLSGPSRD